MENKTIDEINEIYDIEINKIVKTIKKGENKKVLLQFPEGMKPYSTVIANEIEGKTDSEVFIWLGTCFGGCDVPLEVEKLGVDLIIQFGHSVWKF
jgi:2-(3-amino-3-carboxypropyl)histidine synthase|tara:strand:+ start:702 stop:986 length:285 start_codon:yes stop_codon:yes gene_type:complete